MFVFHLGRTENIDVQKARKLFRVLTKKNNRGPGHIAPLSPPVRIGPNDTLNDLTKKMTIEKGNEEVELSSNVHNRSP